MIWSALLLSRMPSRREKYPARAQSSAMPVSAICTILVSASSKIHCSRSAALKTDMKRANTGCDAGVAYAGPHQLAVSPVPCRE